MFIKKYVFKYRDNGNLCSGFSEFFYTHTHTYVCIYIFLSEFCDKLEKSLEFIYTSYKFD